MATVKPGLPTGRKKVSAQSGDFDVARRLWGSWGAEKEVLLFNVTVPSLYIFSIWMPLVDWSCKVYPYYNMSGTFKFMPKSIFSFSSNPADYRALQFVDIYTARTMLKIRKKDCWTSEFREWAWSLSGRSFYTDLFIHRFHSVLIKTNKSHDN